MVFNSNKGVRKMVDPKRTKDRTQRAHTTAAGQQPAAAPGGDLRCARPAKTRDFIKQNQYCSSAWENEQKARCR